MLCHIFRYVMIFMLKLNLKLGSTFTFLNYVQVFNLIYGLLNHLRKKNQSQNTKQLRPKYFGMCFKKSTNTLRKLIRSSIISCKK